MLRTKQLSTLSQCARSFYLSGSRCSSPDPASCTCSDDEKHVTRRRSNNTGFQPRQKTFHTTHRAAAKSALPCFQNSVGSINPHHCESSGYTASASHALAPTSRLKSNLSTVQGKTSSVNDDIHASQKTPVHPSQRTTKHFTKEFTKEGIANVGAFSDLIKSNIPTTNGQDHLMGQNHIGDSIDALPYIKSYGKPNIKTNYSKPQREFTNIVGASTLESATDSNPNNNNERTNSVKATQSIPRASTLPLSAQNQKPSISPSKDFHVDNTLSHRSKSNSEPQKTKFHSDIAIPNTENSDNAVPHKVRSYSDNVISDSKSGGRNSEKKETSRESDNYMPANDFPLPLRSMRSRGTSSTHRSTNIRAVELYYHTLQQLHWGPAVETVLDGLHHKLDPYQANQVLKLLRDHSVALGFFKWLKRQAGFKHDEHTYTTMIGILGHAKQFGAINRLMKEMIHDGCHPTVVTFNRLIHAYGRANYLADAFKVFHQMQEAGHKPDRVTYCTLIDIHAKAGYLDVALDLYERMQAVGLSPDTFTYSVMVNCLGKGGHLAAAYKLFCEMIEQGCVPNLVTYNIMIALQAKARNYPCAVKLYRDMQAAGFRPDKITYSIVMEALGHSGRLDEAEAVFMELRHDWVPDERVYGLLVDIWGKAGDLDKARSWYQSMLDAGLQPNVPTCNSLLSAFLKVHRFSEAFHMLQNMLGLGLVPSLQTYTILLSCCTETRSQLGPCCKLMAISGHPAHTFLVSLPDAEPGGRNVREHASNFLDSLHSEDRESKRGLVDAVVDFLHKSGLKEEAGLVWEVAAERNVYPDSVREKNYSYWLINLHVMSEGTAVTALSRTLAWFQRKKLYSGIVPHRIDIITGWGRRSRTTGSSLVRQSVQELLNFFRFPFFIEHGNSGCFVGCGEALDQWLLNAYVERMHLL